MPDETIFRPARRGDMEAVGRLGGLLVRTHHAFDPQRFLAPGDGLDAGYGAFLVSLLDDPESFVAVAEQDGCVVGYVYAALEPHSWEELREAAGFIHDVVVDPEARGRGIATRLVEAAPAWLHEHGAPRIVLWTAEANPAAQRLFARLGFRRTMVEMTRERP